jgi:hypothetical protein
LNENIQMMGVPIVLESQQPLAWESPALSAVEKAARFCACPNLTFCTARVNVKLVRATAAADEMFSFSPLADRFVKQVTPIPKRSSVVVASSTI